MESRAGTLNFWEAVKGKPKCTWPSFSRRSFTNYDACGAVDKCLPISSTSTPPFGFKRWILGLKIYPEMYRSVRSVFSLSTILSTPPEEFFLVLHFLVLFYPAVSWFMARQTCQLELWIQRSTITCLKFLLFQWIVICFNLISWNHVLAYTSNGASSLSTDQKWWKWAIHWVCKTTNMSIAVIKEGEGKRWLAKTVMFLPLIACYSYFSILNCQYICDAVIE